MKTLKSIFIFLGFLLPLFLNAQSFELLNDRKINGEPAYILPKASFIIEIPVISIERTQGKIQFSSLNANEVSVLQKKYGLDPKKFESIKDGKKVKNHSVSDDSIKITISAAPDYDKIIYVSSTSKWNKNQSINFTYGSDGILSSGESNSENKTYEIVIKALSGIGSIVDANRSRSNTTETNSTFIKELDEILKKIDDLDQINNFDVYKDVKSRLEKKYSTLFSDYFYSEKQKIIIHKVIFTPRKDSLLNSVIPFFVVDPLTGNIKFSKNLKDQLWGKDFSTEVFKDENVYKFIFNDNLEQQLAKFETRPDKSTGFAYNIPRKAEFKLLNKTNKVIFNEIFKIAQFGIIGYVDSKKNAKLTYSLDPITGELLKLSVTGTAILTDQVGSSTTLATEGINLVKGDSADTRLEKEVKRLELEKKKKELLKALEQE